MKKSISLKLLLFVAMFVGNIQCRKQFQPVITAPGAPGLAKSSAVAATIIYTDLNPDVTKICNQYNTPQTFNLDLNKDGTIDFQIGGYANHISFNLSVGVAISSLNTNKVACGSLPPDSLPLAMNPGTAISSNLNWVNVKQPLGMVLRAYHSPNIHWWGNWTDSTDHYLGLKIIKGSNTYYGWVRLSVSVTAGQSSVTIKDYAYNSTPNQQILAGQTK